MEIKRLPFEMDSVMESIEEYIEDFDLTPLEIGKRVAEENGIPFLNLCSVCFQS